MLYGCLKMDAINKHSWGKGEWEDEIDVGEPVTFLYKNYTYVINRSPVSGCLNGYVGVYPGELAESADELFDELFEVHGGITWNEETLPFDVKVVYVSDSPIVRWVGFDTAHCNDYRPRLEHLLKDENEKFITLYPESALFIRKIEHYRNMAYVKGECRSLIDQIIKYETKSKDN